MYFQHSMIIPQMGSDFPRKGCPNVHDWGQVGMFQGENGQGFRAFTKTTFLARLCEADPLIAQPFALIQDFATMLRERQGARLDVWLAQVEEQEISELKNFARGLQKD